MAGLRLWQLAAVFLFFAQSVVLAQPVIVAGDDAEVSERDTGETYVVNNAALARGEANFVAAVRPEIRIRQVATTVVTASAKPAATTVNVVSTPTPAKKNTSTATGAAQAGKGKKANGKKAQGKKANGKGQNAKKTQNKNNAKATSAAARAKGKATSAPASAPGKTKATNTPKAVTPAKSAASVVATRAGKSSASSSGVPTARR